MERALHVGNEITVTWLAHYREEWIARGRIEKMDERYIHLREQNGGLVLIPCWAMRSIDNHGPCPGK